MNCPQCHFDLCSNCGPDNRPRDIQIGGFEEEKKKGMPAERDVDIIYEKGSKEDEMREKKECERRMIEADNKKMAEEASKKKEEDEPKLADKKKKDEADKKAEEAPKKTA